MHLTFVSSSPLSVVCDRSQLTSKPVCGRFTRVKHTTTQTTKCSAITTGMATLKLEIKAVAGEERGIFGMEQEDREALDKLIRVVEDENPVTEPTANNAEAAAGSWRLLYTNLEILGRKRIKLAIATSRKPGFAKLGDFWQVINPASMESKNIVEFKIMTGGTGTFTICAGYEPVSASRVNVTTTSAVLEPAALEKLLGQNKALLTRIFNPEGYLDITYVDESMRIGRDNKGHVFVLERVEG